MLREQKRRTIDSIKLHITNIIRRCWSSSMTAPTLGAQRFKVLLAGVFSQILCVGVARFAYTPLLPVMQQQTWMG
ncbi:MAG: hypothetical protein ACTHXW_11880, partial [Halomonas sp.]